MVVKRGMPDDLYVKKIIICAREQYNYDCYYYATAYSDYPSRFLLRAIFLSRRKKKELRFRPVILPSKT